MINEAAICSDWAKDFVGQNENADEPFFPIFYPVVQDAAKEISHLEWSSKNSERTHDHDASTNSNKTAVGVVTIIICVRDLIPNALTAIKTQMRTTSVFPINTKPKSKKTNQKAKNRNQKMNMTKKMTIKCAYKPLPTAQYD